MFVASGKIRLPNRGSVMLVTTILKERGHECITADRSATVSAVISILAERAIGAVVVTGPGDAIAGIFSERDLVRLLAREGTSGLGRLLGDVMTTPVVTCTAEDTVDHLLAIMSQRKIRHMPVTGPNGLAGMISMRDLVRYRLDEKELEAAVLLERSRFHG